MTSLPIDQLIDTQRGLISREIFVSPEFHKEELEKLFTRAWLFVGHESQIPNPGDYFVSRMGDESVILCRDAQSKVHVFLNSCRHRGMKVCRYEQGNTSLFVCPYHSWSYGTDGKLQGVPMFRALYDGTLDRSQWSLIETPKLQVYKSTVWASWDPEAPDLMTYLGDAVDHLDQVLDCRDGRPGGSEVIGVQKWILPTNWKFAAENFLGDTYHNPSHRSVDMIGIGPSAQRGQRRDNEYAAGQHVWVGFPQGHGMHSVHMPEQFDYQPGYAQYPEVEEYFRQAFYERQRRLGGKARLLPFTGNLFPNTSWHGRQPRGLCVWHPHSATETEAWRFFLVDADAPAVVKEVLRRFYMRYSGPAGMTEQDDMENWLYATQSSKGTIARRYPFNYQASMGAYKVDDPIPGMVSTQITDQTPRNYYRVYARYLKGESWDSLLGRDLAQYPRRGGVAGMIDLANGTVDREIFTSPDVHRQELEKLFTRSWLFVGHESQIPVPGDFFVSRMGDESVIMCRDDRGAIHVFLNSCRHRGMKVCRYEQGNTSLFVCPYHSWSYATDGKLQGVPQYRTLYAGTLNREEWGLVEVAHLANYKGTIWATWDPEAPDFLAWLGDAAEHFDQVIDCRDGRPGGAEVIGVHKWIFPSNWKFAAENFLGDTYHNPSHRSVDMVGMSASAQPGQRRDNEYARGQRVWVGYPQGHGMTSGYVPDDVDYTPTYQQYPEVDEYFRHCFHERKRRLGKRANLLPLVGTIFPNASYHGRQPRGVCVWHPHSATETEAWRFFLVDADAPAIVKDVLRRYYMRYSGPAGMTEQDDMENWLYATAASKGTIAKRYPLNYQMSMRLPNATHLGPGEVATQMTDQTPRNFYRAWQRYMNGDNWDRLLGRDLQPIQRAAE